MFSRSCSVVIVRGRIVEVTVGECVYAFTSCCEFVLGSVRWSRVYYCVV